MDKLSYTILLLVALCVANSDRAFGRPFRAAKGRTDYGSNIKHSTLPEPDLNSIENCDKLSKKELLALKKREYYGLDIADYGNSEEARRAAKQREAMNLVALGNN